MNKTMITLNIPAPTKADSGRDAQWTEARAVFPIYLALAKQLELEMPFAPEKKSLPEKMDPETFNKVHTWLDSMDQQVMVYQLRQLLQTTTLNASESGLSALIQRHLRKSAKTVMDRDKIDFLLVQYFALCAPAKIYHKQIELADVAQVMKPVLGEVEPAPLSWCEPLEKIVEALSGFHSLRQILKTNFIEQGRKVKETAGAMFYDGAALLQFIRFNFLLRRTLIELMHADLIAIRTGLTQLEAAEVRVIDCHHFGLSGAEQLTKIKETAEEWKQPFQKEYTERSVNQAFEKLLGLRMDVENALEKVQGKTAEHASPALSSAAGRNAAAAKKSSSEAGNAAENLPKSERPAEKGAPSTVPGNEDETTLDFESCLEKIWEQLIATPPTRGRSMTTAKIGKARILLSSWEVAAFVSEDGPSAEDLRRAVVARALITAATETAKENGNAAGMAKALSVARIEVSRLQERVDVAKQAKDTEAAVNLGISTKRLLAALDEAEKL